MEESCISFDSYIKPQLYIDHANNSISCISFDSYIKPQPITFKYQRTNILQFLFCYKKSPCKNYCVTKVLKKFQLNWGPYNFLSDFTLFNTFWFSPEIIDVPILLVCNT